MNDSDFQSINYAPLKRSAAAACAWDTTNIISFS